MFRLFALGEPLRVIGALSLGGSFLGPPTPQALFPHHRGPELCLGSLSEPDARSQRWAQPCSSPSLGFTVLHSLVSDTLRTTRLDCFCLVLGGPVPASWQVLGASLPRAPLFAKHITYNVPTDGHSDQRSAPCPPVYSCKHCSVGDKDDLAQSSEVRGPAPDGVKALASCC